MGIVETVAELDGLPYMTIIQPMYRFNHFAFLHAGKDRWQEFGETDWTVSSGINLPAYVLYEPDELFLADVKEYARTAFEERFNVTAAKETWAP